MKKRAVILFGIIAFVAVFVLGLTSTVDTMSAQQPAAVVVAANPRNTNLDALPSARVAQSVPAVNVVERPAPPPPPPNNLTVTLPSGRVAYISFTATAGDVLVGGLLLVLTMIQFFRVGKEYQL